MGTLLVKKKKAVSFGIAVFVSTISGTPAYDRFQSAPSLFISGTIFVFIVIMILFYIFLTLWNFSILYIFLKDKIYSVGKDITTEALMESYDLSETKEKLHETLSKSTDPIKREAIESVLEYMEAIE